ncbi:peptidyl-tRNA hydrolase protein 1 [Mortierella alpina]|uniref:Peptidyl-tRNA hydrolase n=1 Tax=Mortierella alpina TaxID=64518 RepID=A0A9P6M3Q5_MORAP|nr:peptidyl-tRNA hydrolase protein 1 [Mortierella alpina]
MATATKHMLVVGLGNYTHPGTRHNIGMMVVDSLAQRFQAPWYKKGAWQAEVATATTMITLKKKKKPAPRKVRFPNDSAEAKSGPSPALATGSRAPDKSSSQSLLAQTGTEPVETTTLELKLTFLKPLQLMNISGSSVSRAARDLGIPATNILVIHDDMEREIGKLSFKNEGSANGHNGVKSCVKYLGTQHFTRLRVGIGRPPVASRASNVVAGYVLGRFKPLEIEQLEELVYGKAGDEIIRVSTDPNRA